MTVINTDSFKANEKGIDQLERRIRQMMKPVTPDNRFKQDLQKQLGNYNPIAIDRMRNPSLVWILVTGLVMGLICYLIFKKT